MSVLEAIILGIIQGLTEFIPVSSSGHLVLADTVFGIGDGSLAFDVALHAGTLLALLVVFRADLVQLARAVVARKKEAKLVYLIGLATIPAVITGFFLQDYVEDTLRSSVLVAVNLIVIAILMLFAERQFSKQKHPTRLTSINKAQALSVGAAQALAVVPGISRSGSTITAGLFMGLDRVAATRFSFLLGIPIIAGALIQTTIGGDGFSRVQSEPDIFLIGILAAFISGMFAIKFMLRYLAGHSLKVFAYYRIILGLAVLLVWLV
jgi:undecaprenyl-diphosphatase